MAKKTPSEKETRHNLMGWARKYGCEEGLIKIFNRYDELLKHAKSEEEKRLIQVMGVKEIERFFGAPCTLLLNYSPIEEHALKGRVKV